MKTEIQTVTCLAVLDDVFEGLTGAQPGEVVARWETGGQEIILDGVFKSRAMFGGGLRWHCPALGNKGLFGRGIALYGMRMPEWAKALPVVK